MGVRHHLAFPLQKAPERSSKFQSGEKGGKSARIQNPAHNYWVVLAVWTSAKSAERCIFCQYTSSVPRGPHAVSKALGRHWR
jgi:hypothetical protein